MPRARPTSSVLHGGWVLASGDIPAAFAIWGEQSPGVRTRPRLPRKRPANDGRSTVGMRQAAVVPPVEAHPFALSDDGVRHALSVMGLTRWATQTNVRQVFACLPSLPQPEPPYVAPHRSTESVDSPDALRLATWQVPAVILDEVATVSLLPRVAAASAANPGVLGADLRSWIVAARFALSLLVRQRCVPRLQTRDAELISRWSPLIDEPSDRTTLRSIEQAMPPAAIALAWEPEARRTTAREVLADYLAATTDRVVRRARPQLGDVSQLPASLSAWIGSLVREDPVVHLQADGAQLLRSQIPRWTDQNADDAADEAFRLCFRLLPPADTTQQQEKPWRLEYLLQATDDPSLLVPLEEVWRHRGQTARFLTRRFDQPHERVLRALGQASRVFPPIETSLRAARPQCSDLSTREAADLVRDKALLLKARGFGVLLPGLDTRLSVRLQLRGPRERDHEPDPARSDGLGMLTFNSLVSYDWQLALGDQPLSVDEFAMLAQLKEPLVQLRGRWVDVQPDQIERALAFIHKHQAGQMSLGQALSTALAPATLDGVPVQTVEASGWIEGLLDDIRQGARAEVPARPDGFEGTLRAYQQRGVAWLATLQRYGLGALLADDMGLGKTAQIIALLLQRDASPTLVICPTSVVGNWRHELARFAPRLRVLVHHGADRASAEELAVRAIQHDVVLSTYSLLHRDEGSLTRVKWDGIVLDEAQNVKNASTRAAQAARAINARWRVALTGTPVENRLADLWSIFQVINPGYLGTAEAFRRQFALPIERASDADATQRLKSLTAPFILRRVKTDRNVIADLPDKQEMKVYCSLTREQATLYEAVLQDTMRQIAESEGIQRRGLVLALLTRLKQVCNHPALLLHDSSPLAGRSGKLARLGEMLEEVIASDERALVFTQYAEMGRLLQAQLREHLDRDILYLHGGTPMAERDRLVAEFQTDANAAPVFILSLKAGGTGLNLTRANHVFHFDRWWNPAVENQATDRAFRIGQTRNVQVHKYVCAGTFEERLDELIDRKVALAEAIVGTSEAWITELGTDELRQLFRLRRDEAVTEDEV
jgi:superfamily II DNA or RNA helicase